MVTPEERIQMTAEESAEQMAALGGEGQGGTPGPEPSLTTPVRRLRVRVTDLRTGQHRVNVTIPFGLVEFGLKMGARFAPAEVEGLDMEQVLAALKAAGQSKIVDVENEEEGKHVEVFVE